MKHTEFERKKTVNTPLLNQAKTILLKQAICQAENEVRAMIGKDVSLANVEKAIGLLGDAKRAVKIALQDGFFSLAALEKIGRQILDAYLVTGFAGIQDKHDIWCDLLATMPDPEPVKHGIPYRPTDATFVCKCGEPLTIREEIERGFCINCAYGYNENGGA